MSKYRPSSSYLKCLLCRDVIESKHRHDYVTCKCGAVSLDGGTAYSRIATHKAGAQWQLWTGKKWGAVKSIEALADRAAKGDEP